MATTIAIPKKLVTDVTYVLRGDGDGHPGPQADLADRLENYVTRATRTGTCDRRRTPAGEAKHKGVHVCGLKAGHHGDHQCGRLDCGAAWRQLVRTPANVN